MTKRKKKGISKRQRPLQIWNSDLDRWNTCNVLQSAARTCSKKTTSCIKKKKKKSWMIRHNNNEWAAEIKQRERPQSHEWTRVWHMRKKRQRRGKRLPSRPQFRRSATRRQCFSLWRRGSRSSRGLFWSHAGKVWSCGFMSHMRTDKVNGTRAQKWHRRGEQRAGTTTRADTKQLGEVQKKAKEKNGEEEEEEEEKRAWKRRMKMKAAGGCGRIPPPASPKPGLWGGEGAGSGVEFGLRRGKFSGGIQWL